ncbi:SDR family oxidoreductase [Chitinophagaceae bacterium LB-8]|uniref:SDR family oxidoreductase n=1 Tax=Paraflavisolibacter caeni TaxID=2982496 RepID=A0A9X2XZX9_9BACT|nr:SDR family oxidoreductase [Paraflavisolibacter caeni]MCU7551995.1 SDR family oxidoreductase [Paraflavisolibacter caeni]
MSKVVLITGASSGLGESIANHLVQTGFIVYGTSRDIEQQTKAFHAVNMDVTSDQSIQSAIHQILQQHSRIDVLINNAGLGIASPIETLLIDDVQRVLDTNVIGLIRTTQAVLPHMRAQKSGTIINISSIGSESGLPYRGLYSASKAAVDRITEALRIELAPFGIQACVIQPGGVKTDINKNRIRTSLPAGNIYKESFDTTYALIDESVDKGLDPQEFGNLIEKLLQTPTLKRCYRLGKPIEKLSVILKRVLPSATYEKMIKNHYKIPTRPS